MDVHVGGEGFQRVNALGVSETGDLYVAGVFENALHLGTEAIEAQPSWHNLFVAKYEAATITAIENVPDVMPARSVLAEVYPNPSRGRATIRYEVAAPGRVRLAVYDVLGREVAMLVHGEEGAGRHEAVFDATGLASGVYLYRLEAAGRTATGTLLLRN